MDTHTHTHLQATSLAMVQYLCLMEFSCINIVSAKINLFSLIIINFVNVATLHVLTQQPILLPRPFVVIFKSALSPVNPSGPA